MIFGFSLIFEVRGEVEKVDRGKENGCIIFSSNALFVCRSSQGSNLLILAKFSVPLALYNFQEFKEIVTLL